MFNFCSEDNILNALELNSSFISPAALLTLANTVNFNIPNFSAP